ncbi:hypothetical protein RR46_06506 [Papilio xuthus]|uniref:Uncharacterized protein n=1 Tax=Papilio xuthus TaxID=66420 RepID=A0A194QEH6_PAPXU|nr:hypothetical protein RR46_06506 [Papilio xuthus]
MTRSDDHSNIDSEAGSVRVGRISKLGAVLCPAVCALLLVVIFAVSFVGSKLAIDRYGAFCTNRRYTGAKRYVFPDLNLT